MDNNSLSHTKWTCKYHIVFAPKYRRKVIYKQIKADIAHILSELCKRKGIEIIAAECMSDHIHMFVSIPPEYSVSEVIRYLKGKSSVVVKLFCNTLFGKYLCKSSFHWCIIIRTPSFAHTLSDTLLLTEQNKLPGRKLLSLIRMQYQVLWIFFLLQRNF